MKNKKPSTDAKRGVIPFIKFQIGDFAGLALLLVPNVSSNYLTRDMYEQLQDLFEPLECPRSSCGVDGSDIELVNGVLTIFGKRYNTQFLVSNDSDFYKCASETIGVPVCGMIGAQFMAQHDWKVDPVARTIMIPDYDFDNTPLNYN